jgi:hypothetical protein
MAGTTIIIPLEKILALKPHYNISVDKLQEFKRFYSQIEGEDKRNPIFSKTKKYKMFTKKLIPVNTKIRNSTHNAWQPLVVSKEVDKLKQVVRQYFNKITKDNFSSIKEKLIDEVKEIPYVDIIPLLIDGILKKTYMDKKFINLYVDLCAELWSLTEWHRKMVCIKKTRSGLMWMSNYLEIRTQNKYDGPFKTREKIYEVAFKKINFKNHLLQKLKQEFYKRDEYYKLMDENKQYEEIYNAYKQKVYSILDILFNLFTKRYINESIITTCLVELCGINKEEKVEQNLLAFMYFFEKIVSFISPKVNNYCLIEFKKINRESFSFRTKFLSDDFIKNHKLINKITPNKITPKNKIVQKIERFVKKEITQKEAYLAIQNIIDGNTSPSEIVNNLKKFKYKYKQELITEIIFMKVFNNYHYDYNIIYSKLWYERIIERRDVETSFDLLVDNYEKLVRNNPKGVKNIVTFCYNILKRKSGTSLLKIMVNVLFNNKNKEFFKETFMKIWNKIKDNYKGFNKQIKRLYKVKEVINSIE